MSNADDVLGQPGDADPSAEKGRVLTMRRSRVELRSRKYLARQYVSDDHTGRRSHAETEIDRRRRHEPFDGKSFRGLRAAWEKARRQQ